MRVLADDELRAAHDLVARALHRRPVDDAGWAARRGSYAPGRTFGVVEDATVGNGVVATATSYPSETAVPGGAVLPLAAVTRVAVRADRTRRGLLTALMVAQLDDLRARGDAMALLWSSQSGIYGRFGYGVATRGRSVRVRALRAALRPLAPSGAAVDLVDPGALAAVHDELALRRPGGIVRPPGWWETALSRHDGPLLAAATDGGFALAVPEDRALRVVDLHAGSVAAAAALWRFLLGVDLVGHVEAALRPLDEPLDLLLADPRAARTTAVGDETWLRLVDVPAALAARTFTGPGAVLLAVHDPLLPDNAGVYRIADGTAERVAPLGGVAAELECDVAALACAYLGDRAPSALAATGWWTVHEPAALPRADALFATPVPPWCGTYF